ncbi:hypothetical protein FRC19_004059 [Serendipita sp. 401]|nr:hypothetical protein FRC19_004059 [Serendipita sp. 401]KAG8837173.1 hypothetical protein FRC18_009897 [Serendipita sp. 400]KAG9054257.1 hypothetical protein FS842_005658 [Serendipita sp. 407]
MSITVPYGTFQTPDNTLTKDGGAWLVQQSASEISCHSARNRACEAQGCITCTIFDNAASPSYTLKYTANVSIPMSPYGNTNSLDYSISYHFLWTSDKVNAGVPLSARFSVGSSSNTDNFLSSDHSALWYSDVPDLGDPFFHSGTTSLLKSTDGNTAYIPIILDFSFPKEPGLVEWYLIARKFSVSAPPTSAPPVSGSGSSAQAPSVSSPNSISTSVTRTGTSQSGSTQTASLSDAILPGFSPVADSSAISDNVSSSSTSSSNSASTQNIPIGAIVGGVIGGNFLLGIILFFLFLLYRRGRRISRAKNRGDSTRNLNAADGTGDDVDSTWIPFTTPGRKLGFGVNDSSLDEVNSALPANNQRTIADRTIYPTPPSVVTSQLQSESQQGHSLNHRTLRHDLRQPPILSPPLEVDVPPPAYSTVSDTSRDEVTQGGTEGGYLDTMSTVLSPTSDDLSTMRSGSLEVKLGGSAYRGSGIH